VTGRTTLEAVACHYLELVLRPDRATQPARVLLAPQLVIRKSSVVITATPATTRRQS